MKDDGIIVAQGNGDPDFRLVGDVRIIPGILPDRGHGRGGGKGAGVEEFRNQSASVWKGDGDLFWRTPLKGEYGGHGSGGRTASRGVAPLEFGFLCLFGHWALVIDPEMASVALPAGF